MNDLALPDSLPDDVRQALVKLHDHVLAKVTAQIAAATQPVCVTPDEACRLFPFSRATFDRWLADPREGLEESPEPVVLRPNGPGGKVMVHVARMQRWLDARSARPRVRIRRA